MCCSLACLADIVDYVNVNACVCSNGLYTFICTCNRSSPYFTCECNSNTVHIIHIMYILYVHVYRFLCKKEKVHC